MCLQAAAATPANAQLLLHGIAVLMTAASKTAAQKGPDRDLPKRHNPAQTSEPKAKFQRIVQATRAV